jgi:hypothetical protein
MTASPLLRIHALLYINSAFYAPGVRYSRGEESPRPQNREIICRTERGTTLIYHTNFTSAPKRGEQKPFTPVFHPVNLIHSLHMCKEADSISTEKLILI